ncbi:hypothetical protein L7F22_068397 [Adiantum nelumboides]|nr:hypothetical protein [Adiantum nelumboides]
MLSAGNSKKPKGGSRSSASMGGGDDQHEKQLACIKAQGELAGDHWKNISAAAAISGTAAIGADHAGARYTAQMQAINVGSHSTAGSFSSMVTSLPSAPPADQGLISSHHLSEIKWIVHQELIQILTNGVALSLLPPRAIAAADSSSAAASLPRQGSAEGAAGHGRSTTAVHNDNNVTQKALTENIHELNLQLEASRKREQKLQEEVETLRPEQFAFRSGAFDGDGPTPTVFQEALAAVQVALSTFASKLNTQVKQSLPGGKSHRLMFQIQLCHCLFCDFETSSFGGTQVLQDTGIPIFPRPNKDMKRRLFKEYLDYKGVSEANLLADPQQMFFKALRDLKGKIFVQNWGDCAPFPSQQLRESLLVKNSLPLDFARVAKAVWLLHKLAFSFEPTAEIFRVQEGCLFDSEYMETPEGEDGIDKKELAAAQTLMLVPGFTVRNFVFKAHVYLTVAGAKGKKYETGAHLLLFILYNDCV